MSVLFGKAVDNKLRYFGGKSKIAKNISNFINNIIEKGFNTCNTLEENKKSQSTYQTSLIPHTHTHTHTLCRTFLWFM